MIKIVSVKFKNGGKPYYFAPGKDKYEKGMGVIVETAKGLEYATVVQPECEVGDDEVVQPLKPVVRIATKKDEEQIKKNEERRGEAMKAAQAKVNERGLAMKIVDCEFSFDGTKVTFFFTAESRVDFRELIKDLSFEFHMRIELRQIGIRDEIKILGGIAPCGRECCCSACMPEPKKVSVKMAKNQGLSLNPGKISGLCGRLMCCLSYENDYYCEVCKKVPKLGSEVETPNGKGIVVNVNMLKMDVKVKIEERDSVSYHDFKVDEIRFMRGNVMMGKTDDDDADDTDELQPEDEDVVQTYEQSSAETEHKAPREHFNRRENRDRNENRDKNDNRGDRNNGGDRNDNHGRNRHGKNRHNQNRGEQNNGDNRNNGGENAQNRNGNNQPRRDNSNGQNGGQGDNPNRQGGEHRNKKHHNRHRHGGNKPVQDGGNGQNNN